MTQTSCLGGVALYRRIILRIKEDFRSRFVQIDPGPPEQRGGHAAEHTALPIDPRRQIAIAAAVAAHIATHRRPWLTSDATRLLTAMFAEADVCRRNQESLMAEGFSRGILAQLLGDLIEVGLVSKGRGVSRGVSRAPNTYTLHLPPVRR